MYIGRVLVGLFNTKETFQSHEMHAVFDSIEFSVKHNCLTDIGPCINGVRIALDKSWWVLGFYR